MSTTKTIATEADVAQFLEAVPDLGRREDAVTLCALMERVIGEPARMWGPSIVGFGRYALQFA